MNGTLFDLATVPVRSSDAADRVKIAREDARFKILRILEQHPEFSQREIAEALGISLGGVNYLLKALVSKGHVKVTNFRHSDRKMRYAYILTPSGITERALLTGRFLRRKLQEYEAIKAEINGLMAEVSTKGDADLLTDRNGVE